MKKCITFIVLIVLLGCTKSDKSVNHNQIRIISLSPHITEIIYALKVDSSLIAVTDFCKYPKEAQDKEKIGGLINPNVEKIVSLKPTHLFGVPSHKNLNQQLEKFGLKILMLPNETLGDINNSISIISDTLNVKANGKQLNESINTTLEKLISDISNDSELKAMLVIGREKGSVKNITVAGPNTYISEIWQLMGGINIFDDLNAKYSTVNIEEIIKRNPDVIIELNMNLDNGIMKNEVGEEWSYLSKVNAIKLQNIYNIGGNYALIPGPRVVKLAEDFKNIIKIVNKD